MKNFLQRFYRTDYMIAYRFVDRESGILKNDRQQFISLKNNNKYWNADPLLYKYNNKIYMFYEAYNKKRNCGEIGVATISDNSIVEKRIIIKEPFHMSYPFVFDFNNKIYMIPETSSVKKLMLYEAVDFPYKWKFCKVLMEDIEYSDATLLEYQGINYLFVSKLLSTSLYSDELLLYSMDRDFNLKPHKSNPIITNNEYTRPAGKIFKYHDRLIRVSQDCSNGEYGKALNFNEIITISEENYREKNVVTISPKDIPIRLNKILSGTHTYCRCDDFEVIDVKYSVFDLKKLLIFFYYIPKKLLKKSKVIRRI